MVKQQIDALTREDVKSRTASPEEDAMPAPRHPRSSHGHVAQAGRETPRTKVTPAPENEQRQRDASFKLYQRLLRDDHGCFPVSQHPLAGGDVD